MIDYTKAFAASNPQSYDQGLRAYMLKVYNFMALGLLITAITAYSTLNYEPLARLMFNLSPNGHMMGTTGLGTIIMFAPLGIAMFFFMGFGRLSFQTSQILFWVYSALTGMSLSALGFMYTGESIARTFLICASMFGGMSIYGYSTQRDLTSIGSFLIMGLWGLIITSVINIWLSSPAIYFATSLIGVGIFLGLIAWDTQKLKAMYYSTGGGEFGQKVAIMGAFNLYLDFINLFLYLIRFLGVRRND